MPNLPIACDLSALTNEEREWLMPEFAALFLTTATIKALTDGYGFKFENVNFDQYVHIAKLVALDRLCCPFIRHAIVQESGSLDVWLYLSGPAGTKEGIASDIRQLTKDNSTIAQLFKQAAEDGE